MDPLRLCLHACMCSLFFFFFPVSFRWLGISISFSPPHRGKASSQTNVEMTQQCQDEANSTFNTAWHPHQSARLFFFCFFFFCSLFNPNQIRSLKLFLAMRKKKKKKKLFILFLLNTVFHRNVLGDLCFTNLYKASESSPSPKPPRVSPGWRRDVADTVRDTSCACQSGNSVMRNVLTKFHIRCCFGGILLFRALTPAFS